MATESGGIAFEAWAVAVPGDEQRQEEQLAAMVRSFQEQPVPYPGPPVARWTPAQLSRLFVKSGQTNGRIDIAAPNDEVDEPRTEPPAEWVCDDDPLRASEYAGVSGADQPTGVDALVKYSGSYPTEGRGTPVTVVYREDPGVDYLARVRDWTAHCATHPESVPPLCVSSGLQPDFTPATATIEGEPVLGFRRFDPDETPGGHGGHPSCIGTAQAALTVRVAGLLVQTEMDIDAAEGPPDWDTAVRPLEAQVAQVIRVIHGAS